MEPTLVIRQFDAFLSARGVHFRGIVIGGSALALLGVIARQTKDCDVLDPALPKPVKLAALDFASERRTAGDPLADDWLNNGPASLTALLPAGWRDRLQPAFRGAALILDTLGRLDLLRTKLFALCDRGTDLGDCLALRPTRAELDQVLPWVEHQDAHPDWPAHVRETLAQLEEKLRHGS